ATRLAAAVLRILGTRPGQTASLRPGPIGGLPRPDKIPLAGSDGSRPPSPARLALYDLRSVINVVAEAFPEKGQIDSIASACGLRNVRYPVGLADEKQLWRAVFKAALEARPEVMAALLNIIGDDIPDRWRDALTEALHEVGLS